MFIKTIKNSLLKINICYKVLNRNIPDCTMYHFCFVGSNGLKNLLKLQSPEIHIPKI